MEHKAQLAAALSAAIAARGLPAAQVAAQLGMKRQRLNQLTRGTSKASAEAITAALDKLGYDVNVTAQVVKRP